MTSPHIDVGSRRVGPGQPCLLIAEVGQGHDGSLGLAHAYIEAVADAGADAVKFQTHVADAESTLDEPFRVRFSEQDATRLDYWRRMEFTSEQWEGLARHAEQVGLLFLSSAFSIAAVELLDRIGVPAWKVGSGEFRSWELLTAMARTGRPVLLSTGMSRVNEVAAGVDAVRANGGHVALLQCTSRYPAKLQDVGLNVLTELRERFDTAVGLSDHSGTPWPALAAMALGADLVEVHVTFDRRMFGPDTPASITLDEISLLAGARDAFFEMLMNPVDKDAMAAELSSMRDLFAKSLAPVRPLPAGTVLEASMLTPKKPGTGIPSEELEQVVGRRLIRDVQPNRLLSREDLEPTR